MARGIRSCRYCGDCALALHDRLFWLEELRDVGLWRRTWVTRRGHRSVKLGMGKLVYGARLSVHSPADRTVKEISLGERLRILPEAGVTVQTLIYAACALFRRIGTISIYDTIWFVAERAVAVS